MKRILNSVRTKIIILAVVIVLAAAGISSIVNVSFATKEITKTVHNYIMTVDDIIFEELKSVTESQGAERATAPEMLNSICNSVKIEGMESAYCYIVSGDGTMLYHPTPEKIGQPVENAVITKVVSDISKGTIPEPEVVEYEFKGVIKYAAYSVAKDGSYIVVVSADESDALSGIREMRITSFICAALIMVFGCVAAWIISGSLSKPIRKVTGTMERLAELDFTTDEELVKISANKDETGAMGRSVIGLQKILIETIRNIRGQSDSLYTAAARLSSSATETKLTTEQVESAIQEIAEGASNQSDETQQATDNVSLMGELVEETGSAVQKLKSNADLMSSTSENAIRILNELNEVNQRTMTSIEDIRVQTNATNESVVKIQDAIQVIATIAEETNLLSLNASIEAARAGEQGKGFAVVASEIQKLAEQSNSSADEIRQTVELLLQESEKSLDVTENVINVISQQDEDVKNTEKAFRAVKSGVDTSLQDISMIANMMERLGEARDRVIDVVQALSAIAEENAAASQETSASVTQVTSIMEEVADNSSHLNEIAESLNQDVSKFKIP